MNTSSWSKEKKEWILKTDQLPLLLLTSLLLSRMTNVKMICRQAVVMTTQTRGHRCCLMSTAKTRAELASLACFIPPVHSSLSCTEVTFDCVVYTNPYCLTKRPCESMVERAQNLLSNERRKGSNPTGH